MLSVISLAARVIFLQNETRLARLRSSLLSSQVKLAFSVHACQRTCDLRASRRTLTAFKRGRKGLSRVFNSFHFANAACSIARQLEAAELELSDLRAAHETTLAELREHEAKVAGRAIIKLDLTGCTSGMRKG